MWREMYYILSLFQISYEEFLAHFRYNQQATLLRELFARIDTDKSGFLTKNEIIEAIKADEELNFTAVNLSQLLITFSKDKTDKIDYNEFARIVASQAKKWAHLFFTSCNRDPLTAIFWEITVDMHATRTIGIFFF